MSDQNKTSESTNQILDRDRNTITLPRARVNLRSRFWFFTWNGYTDGDIESLRILDCDFIIFQSEAGETSGNEHLQGVMYFSNARWLFSIRKKLEGIHLEPCRNFNASKNYCGKDKTYTGYIRYKRDKNSVVELGRYFCKAKKESLGNRLFPYDNNIKDNAGKRFLLWILCKDLDINSEELISREITEPDVVLELGMSGNI